jgi:hypothetical protein
MSTLPMTLSCAVDGGGRALLIVCHSVCIYSRSGVAVREELGDLGATYEIGVSVTDHPHLGAGPVITLK